MPRQTPTRSLVREIIARALGGVWPYPPAQAAPGEAARAVDYQQVAARALGDRFLAGLPIVEDPAMPPGSFRLEACGPPGAQEPGWVMCDPPPQVTREHVEASARYVRQEAERAGLLPPDEAEERRSGRRPCAARHILTLGGARCVACGHLVTAVIAMPGGFGILTAGQVLAAQTAVHDTEDAQHRFRAWLVNFATGLASADTLTTAEAEAVVAAIVPPRDPQPGEPGWSDLVLHRIRGGRTCSAEGHLIPPGRDGCDRCGLRLVGGTPDQRRFMADYLNTPPGRRCLAEAVARRAPGVEIIGTHQAAARAMAAASGCTCPLCTRLRSDESHPRGFRGGRVPPRNRAEAAPRTSEQIDELAHAEACGATWTELEDIISGQDRKPGPLASIPDETVLLVAAGPGPVFEAWRHVAQGTWIGQPGEAHAGLPDADPLAVREMTAGDLRVELDKLGGWQPG